MKTCLDCGDDLPTPLDEFGDIGDERCMSHFLEYQWNKPDRTIEALTELKEELEFKKESLEDRIWIIRNCHEFPDEQALEMYSSEKREINKAIFETNALIRKQKQIIVSKLESWNKVQQGELLCQS